MSEPPHASSWASPPEFYLDENSVSRSVRHFFLDLGYVVHTPGELFGSRDAGYGAPDTEWLRRVAGTGWAIVGRDAKIAERPHELAAYRSARVHMFLLPGEATRQALLDLLALRLRDICVTWARSRTGIWRIRPSGLHPL
jgi:PIN like domain